MTEHGIKVPLAGERRSSIRLGHAVAGDAAQSTDVTVPGGQKWRRDYRAPFVDFTRAAVDSKTGLLIAEQGLDSIHSRLVHTADGTDVPISRWRREAPTTSSATSVEVRGEGPRLELLEVPYDGELLAGDALMEQLARWVADGVIEPGFAATIEEVIDHPEWLSLPGREVTLVGAGAAMGPLNTLSQWGARVVAVDLPDADLWRRIEQMGRDGSGTVTAPVLTDGATPGAHITSDIESLRGWLLQRWADDAATPALGAYAYADGAAHVEAVVAADVLAADLIERRPEGALIYLNTPTDSFLVPPDAVAAARERWSDLALSGRLHGTASRLTGRRAFAPSYRDDLVDDADRTWGLIDTTVSVQGPNYTLAKRIQRWRAVSAAQQGIAVSTTVAPSSWTRSVTSNRALAAVYGAAHRFGVEIFEPETAAPLLAAKLVADLHRKSEVPAHPEQLFSDAAAHGGLWRQPFEPASALWMAGVIGMVKPARRP